MRSTITLEPLQAEQYDAVMGPLFEAYAQDHVRAGTWTADEALAKAREQQAKLLPDGVTTPDHFLYLICTTAGDKVGFTWYALMGSEPRRKAFIYEISIDETARRRGYASQALALVEADARKRGAIEIGLHVFGDNTGARALYKKIGYAETHVNMSKSLTL